MHAVSMTASKIARLLILIVILIGALNLYLLFLGKPNLDNSNVERQYRMRK